MKIAPLPMGLVHSIIVILSGLSRNRSIFHTLVRNLYHYNLFVQLEPFLGLDNNSSITVIKHNFLLKISENYGYYVATVMFTLLKF